MGGLSRTKVFATARGSSVRTPFRSNFSPSASIPSMSSCYDSKQQRPKLCASEMRSSSRCARRAQLRELVRVVRSPACIRFGSRKNQTEKRARRPRRKTIRKRIRDPIRNVRDCTLRKVRMYGAKHGAIHSAGLSRF